MLEIGNAIKALFFLQLTETLTILEISSKQLLVLNHFPTRELQIMVGPERHKRALFCREEETELKDSMKALRRNKIFK